MSENRDELRARFQPGSKWIVKKGAKWGRGRLFHERVFGAVATVAGVECSVVNDLFDPVNIFVNIEGYGNTLIAHTDLEPYFKEGDRVIVAEGAKSCLSRSNPPDLELSGPARVSRNAPDFEGDVIVHFESTGSVGLVNVAYLEKAEPQDTPTKPEESEKVKLLSTEARERFDKISDPTLLDYYRQGVITLEELREYHFLSNN